MNLYMQLVISIFCHVCIPAYANELPEGWVDPGNMITFDPVSKVNHNPKDISKNENAEKLPELPNCPSVICPKCHEAPQVVESNNDNVKDLIFMKRFVAVLLKKLLTVGKPREFSKYTITVELSRHDWTLLEEFCADSDVAVQEVLQKLEDSFHDVSPYQSNHNEKWFWKFEQIFHIAVDDAIKCLLVLMLGVAILSSEYFSRVSWYNQFKRLLVILIIISFIFTYIHQYQIAVAKHNAALSRSDLEHCVDGKKKMTRLEEIKSTFRHYFSTEEDECVKYHEGYTKHPIVTVPPTKVIAVTISEFVFEPMSHLGKSFSKTFRNMFSELPAQLWIPAFVFVIILCIVVLLLLTVCFGYSWNLHLPFWSGLEIAPPTHALTSRHHEEMVSSLRQQIENQHQLIIAMKENNRPAIEYPRDKDHTWGSSIRRLLGFSGDTTPDAPPHQTEDSPPAEPFAANEPISSDFSVPPREFGEGLRRRYPPPPTRLPYPPTSAFSSMPNVSTHFAENSDQFHVNYNGDGTLCDSVKHTPFDPTEEIPLTQSTTVVYTTGSLGEPPSYDETNSKPEPKREIGFARHILEKAAASDDFQIKLNANLPSESDADTFSSPEGPTSGESQSNPVETIKHKNC